MFIFCSVVSTHKSSGKIEAKNRSVINDVFVSLVTSGQEARIVVKSVFHQLTELIEQTK